MTVISVPKDATALDVLAKRYRIALDKRQGSREQWIESTLELAAVMLEARALLPSHQEYSRWLTHHQLEYLSPNDRRALSGIGEMERNKPGTGRKLLEDNFGFAWRVIWETKAKTAKGAPIIRDKGPVSKNAGSDRRKRHQSGATKRARRNRIPDVMRDDNPPPPVRGSITLNALTPEQVDPDFKGTAVQFTTKYGHVLLQTKDEIEHNKHQEALAAWLGAVSEHERTARALLAAPAVDPETLRQWMSKPAKKEKLQAWRESIERAWKSLCT